jgi:hypothetical protein
MLPPVQEGVIRKDTTPLPKELDTLDEAQCSNL